MNTKFKIQHQKSNKYFAQGFTFPELVIVLSIFATLVGLVTINLITAKQKTSLNTSIDILISDMSQQQSKAMIGDIDNDTAPTQYGIHFNATSYVLFQGTTYDSNAPSNFIVALGDNISFTGNPTDVTFQRVSGELPVGGTIVLLDNTTNSQKTIMYNKLGKVTGVQ